jgi:hypothetical protein
MYSYEVVARRGVVPRRLLGRSRLPAYLPWARFGGGGGAVLAGLSAARGAVYTGGAPAAVGRGAGWRGGLGCDACAGGRVGVAALGGVARARRHTMAGVDKSSVAAASHTLAAVASTAMITLQPARPLRRRRAPQHGRPARALLAHPARPCPLP